MNDHLLLYAVALWLREIYFLNDDSLIRQVSFALISFYLFFFCFVFVLKENRSNTEIVRLLFTLEKPIEKHLIFTCVF